MMNMELSRRSFLRGVVTVASANVLPTLPAASVPLIRADGVHDDAAGLNALFRGDPFRCEDSAIQIVDDLVVSSFLENGHFLVGSPLNLARRVVVRRCIIAVSEDFPEGHPIIMGYHANGVVGCFINGKRRAGAPFIAMESFSS